MSSLFEMFWAFWWVEIWQFVFIKFLEIFFFWLSPLTLAKLNVSKISFFNVWSILYINLDKQKQQFQPIAIISPTPYAIQTESGGQAIGKEIISCHKRTSQQLCFMPG